MLPDPIEHARILVFEEFPNNVQTAVFLVDCNLDGDPDQVEYWAQVAVAVKFWKSQLERSAQA